MSQGFLFPSSVENFHFPRFARLLTARPGGLGHMAKISSRGLSVLSNGSKQKLVWAEEYKVIGVAG